MHKKLFAPMEARVLVHVDKLEEKTEAGIILNSSESHNRQEMAHDVGIIIALGPVAFSNLDEDAPVIGDRVMFNSYAGNKKEIDGEVYRYINDHDFFGHKKKGE